MVAVGLRKDGFGIVAAERLWESMSLTGVLYGGEVVIPNVTGLRRLDGIQNRAGRILLGLSSRAPGVVARGELGWWSMEGRMNECRLRFFGRLVRMKRDRAGGYLCGGNVTARRVGART